MAQRLVINKAQVIAQIQQQIDLCSAYQEQIPNSFAQERVRTLISNPCLSGKFYLNALYKETQIEQSETQAIKYREYLQHQFTFKQIFESDYVPAYVAVYKLVQKQKIDKDKLQQAQKKTQQIYQQSSEQKISNTEYYNQVDENTKDYEKSVEVEREFVPLGFFGPYENYYDAQEKFKQSKYYDNETKKTQDITKSQMKIVGLLPEYHNINYITTQTIKYYIYLDFTPLEEYIKEQDLREYNPHRYDQEYIQDQNSEYINIKTEISLPGTSTRKIFEDFDKKQTTVPQSIHKTLKNQREVYPIQMFYNITEIISKKAAQQLLFEQRKVIECYQELKRQTQIIEKLLERLKQKWNSQMRVVYIKRFMDGLDNNQREQICEQYFDIKDKIKEKTATAKDLEIKSTLEANPLYSLYIRYGELNNLDLLDKRSVIRNITEIKAQIRIQNNKEEYERDYKYIEQLRKELEEQNNYLAQYDEKYEDLTFNKFEAAAKEYLRRFEDHYRDVRYQAEQAKAENKNFLQDFVNSDNQIVITDVVQPRTVIISYDFKCLSSNYFKPALDQYMQQIKKEQGVQKVFKTDPDTGILIKPLVQAGQIYPSGWPFKNLYIDTIDKNEWVQKIKELEELKNAYEILPESIPVPNSEQPVIQQTYGQGEQVIVVQQPPPDPYCDKYFPKNYAELFGVPNILPSLLTIQELLYDQQGFPIMEGEWVFNGEYEEYQERQLTEKHPVSIENGFAYVDIGVEINLCYTVVPLLPGSILIPGVGQEYGSIVAGYFVPLDYENMELVERFPYQNDDPNGKVWWMQCDSLPAIYNAIYGSNKPCMLKFKVYLKYNLPCGFPKKCGILSNKECQLNGKCGLEEFLTKPLKIDYDGLGQMSTERETIYDKTDQILSKVDDKVQDYKKQTKDTFETIDDYKNQIQNINNTEGLMNTLENGGNILGIQQSQAYKDMKNQVSTWKNEYQGMITNAWDVGKNLLQNKFNKDMALQAFTETMKELAPSLTDLIPPECAHIICQAQREAQQNNSINSFSDSINNNVKAAGLMANNMLQSVQKHATSVARGMGNFANTAYSGAQNLVKTFDIYKMCSRRYNDYLKDANPIGDASPVPLLNKNGFKVPNKLDLFTQLQQIFKEEIIGNFMSLLNNCITKNATKLQIENMPGIPRNVRTMLKSANDLGNAIQMNEILKSQGTSLNNMIKNINSSYQAPAAVQNIANINPSSINDLTKTVQLPIGNVQQIADIDSLKQGISIDQINSLSNNSVINLNGVNITKGNLNNTLLSSNILTNLTNDKNGSGIYTITNAITQNSKIDLSGGTTDLNVVTQNIVNTQNFSNAKSTIYNALNNTKAKIEGAQKGDKISSINNTFSSIQQNVQQQADQWIFQKNMDIKDGFRVSQDIKDLTKVKSPAQIMDRVGDLSNIIASKMLQKMLRNSAKKQTEQRINKMNESNSIDVFIATKREQLKQLKIK